MKVLTKSFLDFFRHDGPISAGCITGFFMMSFIPFCLLLFSVFGYFLSQHKEFYVFFVKYFEGSFPEAAQQITEMLTSVIVYRKLSVFTGLLYFYFSYQLYMSLESAVNRMFGIKSSRPFFVSIFLAAVFITLIIIFVILSFAVASMTSIPSVVERVFDLLRINKIMALLVGNVVTMFLSFVAIALLYVFLPIKRVSLRHALLGAAFTSVLLEAAKYLFTYYMVIQSARYGAIYGPLTSFVVFLLWILYASSLFLMGASVVHNLEERDEKGSAG